MVLVRLPGHGNPSSPSYDFITDMRHRDSEVIGVGILNLECVVVPSLNRMAVNTDDANAKVFPFEA